MAKLTNRDIATADADAVAEAIALPRIDEAAAVARPESIRSLYVETEYTELEAEQSPLWAAEGSAAARASKVTAAGLELAAEADEQIASGHTAILRTTADRYQNALEHLSAFVRRPVKAKVPHYAVKALLFLGDGVGLTSAAIWLGELPAIAVIMAISAATATVTAGLSGAEVKDLRARAFRHREPDSLPEALAPYRHLFTGPEAGKGYVRAIVYLSIAIAATLAVAITMLRAVVEDPLVGIVFGAIVAAIAAASFLDSYFYADEIQDLIDHAQLDYEREYARQREHAGAQSWRERTEAATEADSVDREHELRADAASAHVRALRAGVLRRNPGVAGHGPIAEPTVIGQTARRGGTK